MNYQIQNLSRRLVSIHSNNGKTYHLSPGSSYEVSEQEISDNPSIEKLLARKLIRTEAVSSGGAASKSAAKAAAGNPGKARARKSSPKKAAAKKSPARKAKAKKAPAKKATS